MRLRRVIKDKFDFIKQQKGNGLNVCSFSAILRGIIFELMLEWSNLILALCITEHYRFARVRARLHCLYPAISKAIFAPRRKAYTKISRSSSAFRRKRKITSTESNTRQSDVITTITAFLLFFNTTSTPK